MRKVLLTLFILGFMIVGCSHSQPELISKDLPFEGLDGALPPRPDGDLSLRPPLPSRPATEYVEFPDPVLAKAIREKLGLRPEARIPLSMVQTILELSLDADAITLEMYEDTDHLIKDLSGMEYCYRLRNLNLNKQKVTDLTPLATLDQLEFLNVTGNPLFDTFEADALNSPIIQMFCEDGVTVQADVLPGDCAD